MTGHTARRQHVLVQQDLESLQMTYRAGWQRLDCCLEPLGRHKRHHRGHKPEGKPKNCSHVGQRGLLHGEGSRNWTPRECFPSLGENGDSDRRRWGFSNPMIYWQHNRPEP